MNDNFSRLSSSDEIEVKGEQRSSIVDSGFKNNKGTDESYPSAYILFGDIVYCCSGVVAASPLNSAAWNAPE